MNQPYFSFLICSRENNVQIYINGLPLGKMTTAGFEPHTFVLLDGEKKELNINNVVAPFPFKNFDEMKEYIVGIVQGINFK